MNWTFKKVFKAILVGFVVLFLLRLGYGMAYERNRTDEDGGVLYNTMVGGAVQEDSALTKRSTAIQNIATYKMALPAGEKLANNGAGAPAQLLEQKYEKIGDIFSRTDHFDRDDQKLRAQIKHYDALIQSEENAGLKKDRQLRMTIGVAPARFDAMVKDLKKIGKLESINVVKYDRTNEYLKLKAQKASLEEMKASLLALKAKGGKIEEFISLENRIMELNDQARTLGVDLGNYDAHGDFCTINFSLQEGKIRKEIVPFAEILVNSLEWTIGWYLGLLGIFILGALAALLLLKMIEVGKRVLLPSPAVQTPKDQA
ncbi:MAG: DUF4349 domain-containing protein [Solirubrobacterales bacterium]